MVNGFAALWKAGGDQPAIMRGDVWGRDEARWCRAISGGGCADARRPGMKCGGVI